MRLELRKAWLWTKLAVVIILVVWVTLFFVKNAQHKADVWLFFGVQGEQVSLDVIVPIVALATLVVFFVVRKLHGLWRQIGEVRKAEEVRQREQRMENLARQVDQKMKSAEAPKESEP